MIGVIEDRLIASVDTQLLLKPMPLQEKFTTGFNRKPLLEMNSPAIFHFFTGGLRRSGMDNSGCIPRFLKIHSEVNHVDQDLGMPLRLRCPPHDAKTHVRFPVPSDERRDDGMKRSLAGFESVHVILFQSE